MFIKSYNTLYIKDTFMEEFLNIYELHKEKIEDFIQETLGNIGQTSPLKDSKFKKLFETFPSLELVYVLNKETKKQISPNYYRSKIDQTQVDKNRDYLIKKLYFKDNNIAFSSVYISSATRSSCITVSIKEDDEIIFLDLKLETLLERLDLIELNKSFHTLTKSFYTLAGFSMVLLSVFIILYSLGGFLNSLIFQNDFTLDSIFKPVIALTLGIAIFDLAKTILEQEVFFKSYSRNARVETKMITKFLITIIIALSIEALMVVFKIAMENYDKMINALYLIAGVSLIIMALSFFIYITSKKSSLKS